MRRFVTGIYTLCAGLLISNSVITYAQDSLPGPTEITRADHDITGRSYRAAAISPDGSHFALVATGNTVFVGPIQGTSGRYSINNNALPAYVRALAFSPNSEELIIADAQNAIFGWNSSGRKATFPRPEGAVSGPFIKSIAIRQDGGELISCDKNGKLERWNISDLGNPAYLNASTLTAALHSLSYLNSGQVAGVDNLGKVQIVNLTTGAETPFSSVEDPVAVATASPDGTLLATGSDNGKVEVWNLSTGKSIGSFNTGLPMLALEFDKEGTALEFVFANNTFSKRENYRAQLSMPKDPIIRPRDSILPMLIKVSLAVTESLGRAEAASSGAAEAATSASVAATNAASANQGAQTALQSGKGVSQKALAEAKLASQKAASAAQDAQQAQADAAKTAAEAESKVKDARAAADAASKLIDSYSVETGQEALNTANDLAKRADQDATLAEAAKLATQKYLETAQSAIVAATRAALETARLMSVSTTIIPSTPNPSGTLDTSTSPTPKLLLTGHTNYVNSVAFGADGKTLVSGSRDFTVRLWNLTTGRSIWEHPIKSYVSAVAFSQDGSHLAIGGWDNYVREWSVVGNSVSGMRTNYGHKGYVLSIAFQPGGNSLASGSNDKTLSLCNATTLYDKAHTPVKPDAIASVAYSPNGKLLAGGCLDGTVYIWDATTLVEKMRLTSRTKQSVYSVVFLNNTTLASCGKGDLVSIWDLKDEKTPLTLLPGHTGDVYCLAYNPVHGLLASGGADKNIVIWDVRDIKHAAEKTPLTIRSVMEPQRGHLDTVRTLAFSKDGMSMASGSWDKNILIWRVADFYRP